MHFRDPSETIIDRQYSITFDIYSLTSSVDPFSVNTEETAGAGITTTNLGTVLYAEACVKIDGDSRLYFGEI